MTQAKIEPGKTSISLAGKGESRRKNPEETGKEKNPLPGLGLKSPAKKKSARPKPSPLDPGIDLDD